MKMKTLTLFKKLKGKLDDRTKQGEIEIPDIPPEGNLLDGLYILKTMNTPEHSQCNQMSIGTPDDEKTSQHTPVPERCREQREPTASFPVTPEASPKRSPVRSGRATANTSPTGLSRMSCHDGSFTGNPSIDSFLSTITACTGDFFGDKLMSPPDPDDAGYHPPAPPCMIGLNGNQPIPSMITLPNTNSLMSMSTTHAPTDEGMSAANTWSTLSPTPSRIFAHESRRLDELMDQHGKMMHEDERRLPHDPALMYKVADELKPKLIDNVFVLSQPSKSESMFDELSATSSIPTRLSHALS